MAHVASGAAQMDAIYRTQRHFYDLTRKYYLLGRDRLIGDLAVPPHGTVLEVGCGTGRNLIAIARAWPHAQCHGFDISNAMLETATASIARAGLSGKIRLAQGDATRFDPRPMFRKAAFERIVFSYTLSMIPGWRDAIGAAADVLSETGAIHIVDFGQQERLPIWWRSILFGWLARFDVTPRAGLRAVLEAFAAEHGMPLEFTSLYRGYAWSAVLRR
ncbi:class I SAM-dependent methyltransferase [Sphingobium boeckii]|uniref:S-adenosylmethionine-diacylgycerolhomoserine-N-methyltransferase n=1 Tax=Sphingobium boeckii TaxID=1082345 RepID=A0A7W9AGF0_9SPHN|nr:class I SAM-dependent methyltransferase [Sphingobium boeckii]MBB5685195.1 S-adenosylmethionine-diacylgycerolhomoserine-N-methyltransferase [Sphingobium boeckii]